MKKLKNLGKQTKSSENPESFNLEFVDNPHQDKEYVIRLSTPELTSICPITSQPDFGNIYIDYIPRKKILESKSFKLFIHSFRNHGAFHEDCTIYIAKRIINKIEPAWLRISGYWNPRGGIPIDIFYQTGSQPKNVWVDEIKINPYRGR